VQKITIKVQTGIKRLTPVFNALKLFQKLSFLSFLIIYNCLKNGLILSMWNYGNMVASFFWLV